MALVIPHSGGRCKTMVYTQLHTEFMRWKEGGLKEEGNKLEKKVSKISKV